LRRERLVQNAQMRNAHLSRARQAQRELRRERPGAEGDSGESAARRRGIEFTAWCFILLGAAVAVADASAVAANLWAAGPPKD